MIIDIIVILFHLFIQYIAGVYVPGTRIRIRTPCVITWTPYIPLDSLYIIDEPMRSITITLFIINFMNN